jgi:diguanylate cyclase (GGDEF)-like protein/PAS domain S-box-containing protein/putative nucleotidyltransferase with HDIG domain
MAVILLIFIAIFIGLYGPMTDQLEESVLEEFQLTAHNRYQIFHENLISLQNNALALSSRTQVRMALEQYHRGEMSYEEVRDFTAPRYEEGVRVYNRLRTAARVAADGSMIHYVGPDTNIKAYILWDAQEITSRYFPNLNYIVVQVPIRSGEEIIGYDVMLSDIGSAITQVTMGGYDIRVLDELKDERIIVEDGRVKSFIYSQPLRTTVEISMDEEAVFNPARELKAYLYLRYIFALVVAFIIIQMISVRYIGRFAREQQALKEMVEENRIEKELLIDQMNQGFMLIEEGRSENGNVEYTIADANETMGRMVGYKLEELKGRSLLDFVGTDNENALEEIRKVLSKARTEELEYYVSELDRWWIISVYRPRESYLALICKDITENKLMELKLRDQERTLRYTLNIAGEGLWDWHFEEGVVRHNKKWCEIMGVPYDSDYHGIDEFVAQVHPDDEDKLRDNIARAVSGEGILYSEHRMVLQDGRIIWIRDRGALLRDDEGKPVRMIGSMADITAQKRAEENLFLEKEILQSTLLSVEDGIISTDVDGRITVLNPAAEEMTGWSFEEAQGRQLTDVFKLYNLESRIPEDTLEVARQTGNGNHKRAIFVTRFGKELVVNNSVATVRLQDGQTMGYVIVFRDITESVRKQQRIEYLSFHDELTGLYNRRYVEDAIKRLDTPRNLPFTVMIVDMNNLKLTNDIFGHDMGDRIIREAANLLKETLRGDDIIARTGGDEFLILLPKTSAEEAEEIKDRIQRNGHNQRVDSLRISLAIGFSTKIREDEQLEDNLRYADSYMYENKQKNDENVKKEIVIDFLEENRNKFEDERQHNEETSKLAAALYRELGKTPDQVEEFKKAVSLHDIGKVIIPKEILNKKEPLNPEEMVIIKRHSKVGYEILRILGHHEKYAKAIRYHHERFDGGGYPDGLKGDEIPLEARIIAIADAYQSMTSHRPYKEAMTSQDAIKELRENAGKQFDKDLVEIFITKVIGKL